MVCNRCLQVVSDIFKQCGLTPEKIHLGEVVVRDLPVSKQRLHQLDTSLNAWGFERLLSKKERLIETIKRLVLEVIRSKPEDLATIAWPQHLTEQLHHDANYLSALFSSHEGITLEQYIIRQKIERACELLLDDEMNVSEIARHLGYSSVAHLSAQFKRITGISPSDMKRARAFERRKPLDQLSTTHG